MPFWPKFILQASHYQSCAHQTLLPIRLDKSTPARFKTSIFVQKQRKHRVYNFGGNSLIEARTAIERLLLALDGTPIVLVGMMGSGKTSVGRRLALHLERKFLDSDHEIEAAAGMSIEDFFGTHGEPEFRTGETRVIKRLLKEKNIVLATGGGAFVNDSTKKIIHKNSVSVWIDAEFELLFSRVSRKSNRPLLKTANPRQTLKTLIDQRYPIYKEADVHVTTREVPHDTVANEIIGALNLYFNDKSKQS